jgi:hypothetical protein
VNPRYVAFCKAHGYPVESTSYTSRHFRNVEFVKWIQRMRVRFERDRGMSIAHAQDAFTEFLEAQS